MAGKRRDITNQRFGKLVAIKDVGTTTSNSRLWLCLCDCGKEHTAALNNLTSHRVQSCGCSLQGINLKHGHCQGKKGRSPTYISWKSMKLRCLTPSNGAYHKYGAKGITVCDRWLSFENFLKDMGERPQKTTLDRINPDEGYHPLNCRWATRKIQHENQRNNPTRKATQNGLNFWKKS